MIDIKQFSDEDGKHFVKEHKARNIPLTFEEASSLGKYAVYACRNLDDRQATAKSIALLVGLHDQAIYAWQRNGGITQHNLPRNSAEQIAGICAAIFQEDIAQSDFGFLHPNVPFAMDNCGMGGDLTVTANISTIAAFVASAAGIPMCKHGSPANADKGECGSSDFIRLCGINSFTKKKEVEKCVELLSFGYTEALDTRYKLIHMQTHIIANIPHMNDVIGPITNPLSQKLMTRRVMGVNHLIPPKILAEAYCILNEKGFTNLQHGLFVRGFTNNSTESGIDEVSICELGTQVAELKDGEIKEYWLMPEDFGISSMPVELVSPPPTMSKYDFSMAILKREAPTPCLQMAIANAAILFWLAEKSSCLKECYLMAKDVLMSGRAYDRMVEIKKMLTKKEVLC